MLSTICRESGKQIIRDNASIFWVRAMSLQESSRSNPLRRSICDACGAVMILVRIDPYSEGFEQWMFECGCGETLKQIKKIK
jgi:hypothetical protein